MPRAFLTGEWRNLAMLNYVVDPALLEPFVPKGTYLDAWNGRTYVSLVGFMFMRTRLLGVPIPFHRNFEEVNLRFYVRRNVGGEERRGVTFLRELVPRRTIAYVARLAYNEPYTALPMRHEFSLVARGDVAATPRTPARATRHISSVSRESLAAAPKSVHYGWKLSSEWCSMNVHTNGEPRTIAAGSEEEFITEHYWGYTRQRNGSTIEYRVEHPKWKVSAVSRSTVVGNLSELYGDAFAAKLGGPPDSAFLANGSAISVSLPTRLASEV